MATTTIYVPDPLWEELKPLVESKQLNLSQVAVKAARQELDRVKGEQTMSAVVRRMRAEKRGLAGQAALGRHFADEWLEAARYEDLETMVHHGVRNFKDASRHKVDRSGRPLPPLPEGFVALIQPQTAHPDADHPTFDAPDYSARPDVNLPVILDAFDERIEEVWDQVEGEEESAEDR